MACDTRTMNAAQTLTQRKDQVKEAVARLERGLDIGTVKVVVGPSGAITFRGSSLGDDKITDACAYRRLLSSGSAALRRQLARAEAVAGRKVDPRAIAAGEHSHDGGNTWGHH